MSAVWILHDSVTTARSEYLGQGLTGTCKLFRLPRNRNTEAVRLVEHDVSTTPPVLAAELAAAWADIQRHHSELPDLAAPESLIGESSSACGSGLSFERLLHEAVHGIAAARGIRDTSRAGRYHNRRFLAIAEELGLVHPEEPHPSSGFSLVTPSPDTRRRYRPTSERLQRALAAYSAATETDTGSSFRGPAARHGSSGGGVRVKAVCDCGRNVRVVPSVLAQAPIMCGACGKQFRIPETAGEQAPAAGRVQAVAAAVG
ncbi:hypothetical protein H181DRAFT_03079 [Streptomyces sp. WMMB 714]|nr:hypothetical protein H181DRAFT_03079 [Streptomyces sp. WMMB 714]